MGVSHVIRGDDHVTNTGVQIALFQALGAEPPVFGHHNLLTTASGEGLSKRTGALSIAGLREAGIEPMAVASLAVLVGTSENVAAVPTMAELAERFDLAATSKSASKFDPAELIVLNRDVAPPHAVRRGARPADRARHIRTIRQRRSGWRFAAISTGSPTPRAGGASSRQGRRKRRNFRTRTRAFVREAFDLLPHEPWDRDDLERLDGPGQGSDRPQGQGAVHAAAGWRLLDLSSGPELADLLPLLGREGTLARRP